MTAFEIANRLLEADPDAVDPQRYLDAYAETQGFDDGMMSAIRLCRAAYLKLKADGIIERMARDWARRHWNRELGNEDIAQGIMWMTLDSSGLYGPDWVHKWFRKNVGGRYF